MTRDVSKLTTGIFDVLVIGGGVYGLTIAYDAAQRGLSVALIERNDFGSGSSFNHLRTIHGGLRYLQSLDFGRARESILERRTLARIAPHAVRPMAFVLPLYRSLAKGRWAMRVGLAIDRFVGRDRNAGVPPSLKLPAGRVLSPEDAIRRSPGLPRQGLTGAALWYDYVTPESDRLTWAWAEAAVDHGAHLANYVEATALVRDGIRVAGAQATDRHTGGNITINARVTVNATGAGLDRLLNPLHIATNMPRLKAMNFVTTREAGPAALGGRPISGRHLFLVPWRGRALFGTWESALPVMTAETAVTEAEVALFIDELNEAFPGLELKIREISLVHRGIVPGAATANGSITLERHERIRDHAADGVEGLLSVAGTKYTTARAVAERVTDRLMAKLGRRRTPSRTAVTRLPGGTPTEVVQTPGARPDDGRTVPSETLPHLVAAYGTRHEAVLALAASQPQWASWLSDDSPVVGAELIWAVRHEMAVTLSDAVVRRTPLGALGYPGDAATETAAAIVGEELGWSEERKEHEIAALRAFYRIESRPTEP